MTAKIVECVPNFSEGRREPVIQALVGAVRAVPGALLLDRHSDPDHNRTVLTFAGEPQAVFQAAFAAIRTAAELIDLNHHQGEHPRIGATDVVPFVPIAGVSMDECVELARRLGQKVAQELDIPVYLYEAAATRPERVNLENVRRGEYEGLKEAIARDPERQPDFGPTRLGPAGATVIGARQPLIAYNVYLSTDDVQVAKRIARAVRHSSGGLRYVKALGMLVEGRAQVSMNLTDYRRTPVARVVEFIRREAARYGVSIHHSELVGLIPQDALLDAAQWYLQLDEFDKDQVLEVRLQQAMREAGGERSVFLQELAAATPTPGGGSAAAYACAMGAALTAMVARLTIGKKKYQAVEAEMGEILEEALALQAALAAGVQQDAQAFDAVLAAYRMPRQTEEEKDARAEAIQRATLQAAQVPLEAARRGVQVMGLALKALNKGNRNAASDAYSAIQLAHAGVAAALANVRINAVALKDEKARADLEGEAQELQQKAHDLLERAEAAFRERAAD
jgi:glutamate formiminotransferase/formiminotetrahydrofolate cyclodeaminase